MSNPDLGLFHSTLRSFLKENDPDGVSQDLFGEATALEQRLLEEGARIYRGLPRLYHRDVPSRSRVKKEFLDFHVLMKLLKEKDSIDSGDPCQIPKGVKISFFTWVICDGWGDYVAAQQAIQILKNRFPHLEIDWVLLMSAKRKTPPLSSFCKTFLITYEDERDISLITETALQAMRSSRLIIQIPTYYPAMEALWQKVIKLKAPFPQPKLISIGEYGFLESQWFHPETGNYSMGLHFLEQGILIRDDFAIETPSFKMVGHALLIKWLFPHGIEESSYFAAHDFYVAYLATPVGGMIYLHALMKAHESSRKILDICCPSLDWFIASIQLEQKEDRALFAKEGWALDVYTEEKIYKLWDQKAKRRLRLFSLGWVSTNDIQVLIHLSAPFVAVRGDQSFSEVISAERPFFYDGRDHARYFVKDLLALAENRIRPYKASLTMLRLMKEATLLNVDLEQRTWVEESHFQEKRPWRQIAEELGLALQDPKASAGFVHLAKIIRQEHSFNDRFCRLIAKEIRALFAPS